MNPTHPIISFALCLVLTPCVRSIARKKGWMAQPTKDRWHKQPTALAGGIAIYLSMSLPLLYISDFSTIVPHFFRNSNPPPLPSIDAVIWLGLTFLFIVGLFDDFLRVKPYTKLVAQILVASLVVFLGFRLHWLTSLTADTTLTILWIVGITNAFNLLDNMDGLCAGIGSIASVYVAVLLLDKFPYGSVVALMLFGTTLAFLIYNFNPASIFMGDSGSLLIGFTLAVLTVCYPEMEAANTISIYAVPVLVMMVPIFDTTLVTLIRTLSGRKASQGGKDHTSHRLVLMGLSEKGAVVFLYAVTAISGLAAWLVSTQDTLTSPAVIIPIVLSFLLMGIYLAQLRVYPEQEFSLLRDRPYTPILMELTYKRQLMLVLLDFFLIAFVYYLSYRLRFDTSDFPFYFKVFLRSLPAVIACKFIAFFTVGVYRGIWGFMSTDDVFVQLKASTMASLLSVAAVTFIYRFENFSKGIFVIDWLLTTSYLLGTRGSFRLFLETMKRKTLSGQSVLIYGAGRGGEILLREILNNKQLNIKPVGFIDDDPLKEGKKLQGYTILGPFSELGSVLDKYPVDGILISFRYNDTSKLESVKESCKKRNLFLKRFNICLEDVDLESR
ncbi:MAG: glycosyl transferase [Deltaproteobacteria bacterium]|nr:glycosyl transferase [Deltaproteobacteria bacterium]